MVGARARDYYDRQAKERQKASGGDRKSEKARSVQVNLPEPISGQARDHAARAVGVSGKSIDYATKVIKHAVPEIIKKGNKTRAGKECPMVVNLPPSESGKALDQAAEDIGTALQRDRSFWPDR